MSNFQTYELLPKEIYTIYGEAGLRWLDPKIIGVLEFVEAPSGSLSSLMIGTWAVNSMSGRFASQGIPITIGASLVIKRASR